jgi:hypothetical protein
VADVAVDGGPRRYILKVKRSPIAKFIAFSSSRARSSVIDTFDDIGCRGFIAARLEARPKHLSFSRKRSHQGQHRDCKQYPSQNVTSIPMVLIVSNR